MNEICYIKDKAEPRVRNHAIHARDSLCLRSNCTSRSSFINNWATGKGRAILQAGSEEMLRRIQNEQL